MVYVEVVLIGLSLALTVIGFKTSNRNKMLAGYICLVVALAVGPFVTGFGEGYNKQKDAHETGR